MKFDHPSKPFSARIAAFGSIVSAGLVSTNHTFQNSWKQGRTCQLVFDDNAMFCSACEEAPAVDAAVSHKNSFTSGNCQFELEFIKLHEESRNQKSAKAIVAAKNCPCETRRPLLKDRASQRGSATAVLNVAADNTVVSTASSVAVPIASPVAGTVAESNFDAASVALDPETEPSAPVAQKWTHNLDQRKHCIQLSYCQ